MPYEAVENSSSAPLQGPLQVQLPRPGTVPAVSLYIPELPEDTMLQQRIRKRIETNIESGTITDLSEQALKEFLDTPIGNASARLYKKKLVRDGKTEEEADAQVRQESDSLIKDILTDPYYKQLLAQSQLPLSPREVSAGVDSIISQMERFRRVARSGVNGEVSVQSNIAQNHHTNSYFGTTYEVLGDFFSGGKCGVHEQIMLRASEDRMKNFVRQADDLSFFILEIGEVRDETLKRLVPEKEPHTISPHRDPAGRTQYAPTKEPHTISYIGVRRYGDYRLRDYMGEARAMLAQNNMVRLTRLLSYSHEFVQSEFPLGVEIALNTSEGRRLDAVARSFAAAAEQNLDISEFALQKAEKAGDLADVGLMLYGGEALAAGKAGLKRMAVKSLTKPKGLMSLAPIPGLREVATAGIKRSFKQEAKYTAKIGVTLAAKDLLKETVAQTVHYALGNKTSEAAFGDWKTKVFAALKRKAAWTLGAVLGGGFNMGVVALFNKLRIFEKIPFKFLEDSIRGITKPKVAVQQNIQDIIDNSGQLLLMILPTPGRGKRP